MHSGKKGTHHKCTLAKLLTLVPPVPPFFASEQEPPQSQKDEGRWAPPKVSAGRLLMEGGSWHSIAAVSSTAAERRPPDIEPAVKVEVNRPPPPPPPPIISQNNSSATAAAAIKVSPRMHRDQLIKHIELHNVDGSRQVVEMAVPPPQPQSKSAAADTYNAATAMAGMFLSTQNRCLHSHKAWPECPTPNGTVALLVTGEKPLRDVGNIFSNNPFPGVGRSGTHHTQHALMKKGFKLCHECVCDEGSVSWTYAVVDPDTMYPWEWSRNRIQGRRFQKIVHQVG